MTRATLPRSLSSNIPVSGGYPNDIDAVTIKRFSDQTGVSYPLGSPTVSVTDEIGGVSMIKMVTAVSTNAEIQISPNPAISVPRPGNLMWLVYVPDSTAVSEIRLLAGPTGFSPGWWQNQFTIHLSGSVLRDRNGWHMIELGRLIGGPSGTFDWQSANIQVMKARVIPVAGKSATVYFHGVTMRSRRRPCWVIGFDDNRGGVLTAGAAITLRGTPGTYSGKDILDAYGFKATMYIVGSLANTGTNLTSAQIQSLAAAGWDIQAQCWTNTIGTSTHGHRLLGPFGFGPYGFASVDAAANTLTASAAHVLPNAGEYGFPIVLRGSDLPAPLQPLTTYWARKTSATAFTLHPTEADSLAGTNTIDLTSTGTAANFAYSYAGSRIDDSAIYEDFERINGYIESLGVPRPQHVAYNQGGADTWVHSAALRAGYKTLRSTDTFWATAWTPTPDEMEMVGAWPLNNVYQIEGAISEATIKGYVDAVIARGLVGGGYTHYVDTTNGQALAYLCDYLYKKQLAGEIEVLTVSEAYQRARTGRAVA